MTDTITQHPEFVKWRDAFWSASSVKDIMKLIAEIFAEGRKAGLKEAQTACQAEKAYPDRHTRQHLTIDLCCDAISALGKGK